jgi:succinate dehydrogenase / fumarate reductase cytochrome b subunit
VQVNKIHDLPLLWALEWGLIFLPIIYHTVYGVWITLTGQWNVNRYGYQKNVYYVLQRVSAVVIVLFMLFHILSLKYGLFGANLEFDPHDASRTIHRHMMTSGFLPYFWYPLGILASCYHLANGIWTAGITWGLTVSEGAQRRWGYFSAAVGVAMLLAGLTANFASVNPKLAEEKAATIHVKEGV